MKGRDFKRNRSDSYQWILRETPCSPVVISQFADSQNINDMLGFNHDEQLSELQDQLKEALWRVIDTQLTTRQKEVLHLCADGYTQIEVAKKLKVNQSSITKSINGNCDYRNGRRLYGGSIKRIKKIASEDLEIQSILRQIVELQGE